MSFFSSSKVHPIDIGTCLTPMMGTPTERDYLQGYWSYKGSKSLNLICEWN